MKNSFKEPRYCRDAELTKIIDELNNQIQYVDECETFNTKMETAKSTWLAELKALLAKYENEDSLRGGPDIAVTEEASEQATGPWSRAEPVEAEDDTAAVPVEKDLI